jgi:hypothetical protein
MPHRGAFHKTSVWSWREPALMAGLTVSSRTGCWESTCGGSGSRNDERLCASVFVLSSSNHHILWRVFRAIARCGKFRRNFAKLSRRARGRHVTSL